MKYKLTIKTTLVTDDIGIINMKIKENIDIQDVVNINHIINEGEKLTTIRENEIMTKKIFVTIEERSVCER